MHFVMYASSNHVEVLHNVTPVDLLAQSAVLSDGVVVSGSAQGNSPPLEGWQAKPDGVVFCVPTIFISTATRH